MRCKKALSGIACALLALAAVPLEDRPEVALDRRGTPPRATVRVRCAAPEGALYAARILPCVRRLGDDGRTLVVAPIESGAVACRAEARRGFVTVSFPLGRIFDHEVRLVRVSKDAPEESVAVRVFLFDPSATAPRLRREMAVLAEHSARFQELFTALEPFQAANQVPDDSLIEPLREALQKVRAWGQQTDFAAASSVLIKLIDGISRSFCWIGKNGRPAEPITPGKALSVEVFRDKLAFAEEVAAREACLIILESAEEALHRPPEGSRDALRALRKLLTEGDAFARCAAAPAAAQALSDAEEALLGPVEGRAPVIERLQALEREISGAK